MRTAKFNALSVKELSANFISSDPALEGKAAFVSTLTQKTHGQTIGKVWSKDTLDLLTQLKASMEADLETVHFADGPTSSSINQQPRQIDEAFEGGGIGEHIGGERQVLPRC